jgi:hypothetical protein
MKTYDEVKPDVNLGPSALHDVAKLANRIGQLLRLLLGSDKAGETIAAVAALRRVLSAAGLDHHDLAAAVEAGLRVPLVPLDDNYEEEWKSIARYCDLHSDALSDKEAQFVRNILKYRKLSEKQLDWLADIQARLIDEGR